MKTKRLHLSLALILGLLAVAGALALLMTWGGGPPVAQAMGDIRYVSSVSGNDSGDCVSQTAPCQTIQYAVDQSHDHDEIRIAAFDVSGSLLSPVTTTASYTGTGYNVIELTKSLALRGGYVYVHISGPPAAWTPGLVPADVDGEGARRALYVSGVTPTLQLLSFVNGSATQGGNVYAEDATLRFVATPVMSGTATYGGGLYLKNCRTSFDAGDLGWVNLLGIANLLPVQNNSASYGGGIYVEGGTPILTGLDVNANTATSDGGGFYLNSGQAIVAGGLVMGNQARNRGGGFFLGNSPARIAGTYVYSNTADDGAGFYLDGPFAFSEETVPIIANNYVRSNRSTGSQGGGFYFHQAIAGLVNNVIADNAATDGAAMYLWASSPQLFHNTIAQNTGNSGIYATNKPGSIWPPIIPIPSQPSFTNTIIVSQTVGVYVASTGLPLPLQNKATLEGTLWWGNGDDTAGSGPVVHTADVYGDPKFTCTGDPPGCLQPYHVLTDSAAVDAGVPVALTLLGTDLLVDIDLELRPSGKGYDIGADEVVSETYSVWLVPPFSALPAEPGQTVTHTHWLMNTGLQTDTYDLSYDSSSGWTTPTTVSPITLAAQTSTTVQVPVSVSPAATNGMSDTTILTATSPHAQANAVDVTRVVTGAKADMSVGKWADAEIVQAGKAAQYTIAITKSGSLTGTLAVTLTDTVVPTQAFTALRLPTNCAGDEATGLITCTWSLPGSDPLVTRTLTIAITTTSVYTGLLINTAEVSAAALDPDTSNNEAQAAVGVTQGWKIYLPLVLRGW